MGTVRKTITLTEQQDAWIAAQIHAGHYTNDSEAIRDLIRREQERSFEIDTLRQASSRANRAERRRRSTSRPSSAGKKPSMAEYRLSPKAQTDLDEIFDYTVTQWGLPQALRYTDIIEAACLALAEARLSAQNCAALRPGYWRRTVEQHVIYFQRTPYGIAVIRILHQKMDAARHF